MKTQQLSPQAWFTQHLLTTTKPTITLYFRGKEPEYVERFVAHWNERYSQRQLLPLHYARDSEGISLKCKLSPYLD